MAATRRAQVVREDTKEFITRSLLEALKREKLSVVTVSQVCKRAGVSRMAFYRNFEGLEQVVYEHYLAKISPVFQVVRRSMTFEEKHDSQLELFETIGEEMVDSVNHGFEHLIRRVFVAEIRKFYESSHDEYWLEFISSGVYSIWQKWLLDGRRTPLSEIMYFLKQVDSLIGSGSSIAKGES